MKSVGVEREGHQEYLKPPIMISLTKLKNSAKCMRKFQSTEKVGPGVNSLPVIAEAFRM